MHHEVKRGAFFIFRGAFQKERGAFSAEPGAFRVSWCIFASLYAYCGPIISNPAVWGVLKRRPP